VGMRYKYSAKAGRVNRHTMWCL